MNTRCTHWTGPNWIRSFSHSLNFHFWIAVVPLDGRIERKRGESEIEGKFQFGLSLFILHSIQYIYRDREEETGWMTIADVAVTTTTTTTGATIDCWLDCFDLTILIKLKFDFLLYTHTHKHIAHQWWRHKLPFLFDSLLLHLSMCVKVCVQINQKILFACWCCCCRWTKLNICIRF